MEKLRRSLKPHPSIADVIRLTAIIPAHNPHPVRLVRTLAALAAQTLPAENWSVLLVDNASGSPITPPPSSPALARQLRLVRENQLGLTAARRRGVLESVGDLIVFIDDDNVLAPDYLENVVRIFAANPRLGAIGGKIAAEFETPPPSWIGEFHGLLACRDLGRESIVASRSRDPHTGRNAYPPSAPVGAGLALRRAALDPWIAASARSPLTDRRGASLSSGGDNEIIFTLLAHGWSVGYFPELRLTHLIPASRLRPGYLGRLNHGVQRSWIQVLARHDANPWPPIAPWTVPLRKAKAWFAYRAWSGAPARIRWQGACGHFEGRASLPHPPPS